MSNYKSVDMDGTMDGPDKKQSAGPYFVAEVGKRYRVPYDAGNYVKLRGVAGICVEYQETSFGMSWAVMDFDNDVRRKVRTSYLESEDGSDNKPVATQVEDATDPVKEKFAGVWDSDWREGVTETLKGY